METKKHFCILPWIHLNVMPDATVIPCCVSPYDDIYGDGKKQTLSEIWNSDKYKKLRLNMLADMPLKSCAHCYQLEATGFVSLRQDMNKHFSESFDLVKRTKIDGSLDQMQLKYIDIRFSNLCNFKCRGCSPALSSSWLEDHQKLYSYKSETQKNKSIETCAPNFLTELTSQIPLAEVVYFGGGEPLITKEHFEVLKLLEANNKFDIELRYTTNLSILNYGSHNLSDSWLKFKKVSLGISIDDLGVRAEYFRSGTKWSQVENNLIALRDHYPQIERIVNCTVSIYNVYYLPEIIEYLLINNFITIYNFNINLLLDPEAFRIDNSPIEFKKIVSKRIKKYQMQLFIQKENPHTLIKNLDKVISFLNQQSKSSTEMSFQELSPKLDSIRSENFSITYPEIAKYF